MFETYQNNRPQKQLKFKIVEATHLHINSAAKISMERQGCGDLEEIENELASCLTDRNARLFLAIIDCKVVGFGKTKKFTGKAYSHEGWYLCGIVVKPEYRGAGIGKELTRVRLVHLRSIVDKVYYFANVKNTVSIRLHESFGFRKLTESFSFPKVTFTGGRGCLYEVRKNE